MAERWLNIGAILDKVPYDMDLRTEFRQRYVDGVLTFQRFPKHLSPEENREVRNQEIAKFLNVPIKVIRAQRDRELSALAAKLLGEQVLTGAVVIPCRVENLPGPGPRRGKRKIPAFQSCFTRDT